MSSTRKEIRHHEQEQHKSQETKTDPERHEKSELSNTDSKNLPLQ